MYKLLGISVILLLIAFISNCKRDNNETKISHNGENESHYMGQNCMDCHKQGGDGEGWFTAAGTVYDSADKAPLPNGIVKLYSGRNATGSVVATIQVDAKGNFYTTEKIDFAPGLHPVVSDQATKTVYMADSTTSGSCNSCHGVSTPHIRVY